MHPIIRETFEPTHRRWTIVAAAVAGLFVAAVVILAVHASPAAPSPDRVHAADTGL